MAENNAGSNVFGIHKPVIPIPTATAITLAQLRGSKKSYLDTQGKKYHYQLPIRQQH